MSMTGCSTLLRMHRHFWIQRRAHQCSGGTPHKNAMRCAWAWIFFVPWTYLAAAKLLPNQRRKRQNSEPCYAMPIAHLVANITMFASCGIVLWTTRCLFVREISLPYLHRCSANVSSLSLSLDQTSLDDALQQDLNLCARVHSMAYFAGRNAYGDTNGSLPKILDVRLSVFVSLSVNKSKQMMPNNVLKTGIISQSLVCLMPAQTRCRIRSWAVGTSLSMLATASAACPPKILHVPFRCTAWLSAGASKTGTQTFLMGPTLRFVPAQRMGSPRCAVCQPQTVIFSR